jgi:hypothetical protein
MKTWEATQPPEIVVKPKGNSMTQQFYAENMLPHHIKHIKQLKTRYKQEILFQEDNNGSHRTRSTKHVAREAKNDADISTLLHPPQSPDFNPIEAV